jgi:hypothetical protein
MRKLLKQAALSLAVIFGLVLVPVAAVGAINVDPLDNICSESKSDSEVCKEKARNEDISVTIGDVINLLLFVVGAISVIMIIVGGILYAVSTGDQSRITKAKYTIIYAVAGLVVSLLAYAIVNFVVDSF